MRRVWPVTESTLAVSVFGLALGWYHGGNRLLDALLHRMPADERLITACAARDDAGFDAALAAGASVAGRDPNGVTALAYAAITGSEARVSRLLAAGADVNAADKWGFTPLMRAAALNQTKIVQMLLTCGADPLRRNANGETAADRARLRESASAIAVLAAWRRTLLVAQL